MGITEEKHMFTKGHFLFPQLKYYHFVDPISDLKNSLLLGKSSLLCTVLSFDKISLVIIRDCISIQEEVFHCKSGFSVKFYIVRGEKGGGLSPKYLNGV